MSSTWHLGFITGGTLVALCVETESGGWQCGPEEVSDVDSWETLSVPGAITEI